MIATVLRLAPVRWLINHGNPILIRQVRQELRNRAFFGQFSLLLLIAVLVSLSQAALGARAGDEAHGHLLFSWLMAALGFILFATQPINAYRAMVFERDDDTWDLLELTGLPPRTLLRGILLANLTQSLLYTAAIAPFIVWAYMLRGIDLITIVTTIFISLAVSVLLAAGGITWACLGATKGARGRLAILWYLVAIGMWMWGSGLFIALAIEGGFIEAFRNDPAEAWTVTALIVNGWLDLLALLLVFSGALLTFRAGNRVSGPRLVWLLVLLNIILWLVIGPWIDRGRPEEEAFYVAAGLGMLWSAILALVAITEDRKLTTRQAAWITQAHGWRKACAWFLGPGSGRGRCAVLVGIGLSLLPFIAACILDYDKDGVWFTIGSLGYLFMLIGIYDLIMTTPLGRLFKTPALRRMLLVGIPVLLIIVSVIQMLLPDHGLFALNMLNPV
ncbi:MAG: hypothetical protein ACYTF0_06230, partial [Planctomycetota bacterium]